MPIYVMLTSLTDEGRKTVKENPGRIKAVNKEVEAMGVKVVAQYALLGPFDFVNILDAPNNEVVSKVAVELGARGTLRTMTMPALSVDEFTKAFTKK
ncbi:MAG: GYD domain-containing protein [Chloroflexota bacterium]